MPSLLLAAPAVEPVSLDEARAFLRVEHNDDDEVIAALAAGSRIHVEAQTRRALITQDWRISADCWPQDGRLTILPAPLQSLIAARVYDAGGNAQTLDTQAFVPDPAVNRCNYTKRSSGTLRKSAIFFSAAVVPFRRPDSKSEI